MEEARRVEFAQKDSLDMADLIMKSYLRCKLDVTRDCVEREHFFGAIITPCVVNFCLERIFVLQVQDSYSVPGTNQQRI
jgi:hypothetical protein